MWNVQSKYGFISQRKRFRLTKTSERHSRPRYSPTSTKRLNEHQQTKCSWTWTSSKSLSYNSNNWKNNSISNLTLISSKLWENVSDNFPRWSLLQHTHKLIPIFQLISEDTAWKAKNNETCNKNVPLMQQEQDQTNISSTTFHYSVQFGSHLHSLHISSFSHKRH